MSGNANAQPRSKRHDRGQGGAGRHAEPPSGRDPPRRSARDKEVDDNYVAFRKLMPAIAKTNYNQFALMKNKKIIGFYSTSRDAYSAAQQFIADGIFSIQQVTEASIDLGFYTNAVPVS